jgi:hypothetical protein
MRTSPMYYSYKSKIGTFSIEYDGTDMDEYRLCIGGMGLGSYDTPESAAAAVSMKQSGWIEWDRCEDENVPHDLEEWEKA